MTEPKHLTVPDVIRDIYKHLDRARDRAVAEYPAPVSCTPGCAHCCRMLTTISIPEGLVLAEALLARDDWRDILPRLREAALADSALFVSRLSRINATRIDGSPLGAPVYCGLLDPTTKLCTVYDARPGCCRFHVVVTPPERCSPELAPRGSDGRPEPTGALDFVELEGALWEVVAMISQDIGLTIADQAPISIVTLACLAWLLNVHAEKDAQSGGHRATQLRRDVDLVLHTARHLPDPGQWCAKHGLTLAEETMHDDIDSRHTEKLVQISKRTASTYEKTEGTR